MERHSPRLGERRIGGGGARWRAPAAVVVAALVGAAAIVAGASEPEAPRRAGAHALTRPGRECASCHRMEAGLSHPVDVVPGMPVPDPLPLEGGVMTCTTCHTDTGSADAMLRVPAALLCAACHGERRGPHADPLVGVHEAKRPRAERVTGGLDGASRACLSCHDGGIGSEAASHGAGSRFGAGLGEHPVGVAYDERRPTNPDARLRPAASLPGSVRLVGGVVSCTTCHSVYSAQRGLLTLGNGGSDLCLSCHVN